MRLTDVQNKISFFLGVWTPDHQTSVTDAFR
jgi:hypothetical protein